MMFNGAAIYWNSKRQNVWPCHLKRGFMAASALVQELIYLGKLFEHPGYPPTGPTPIFEDNRTSP
jgi:hypothetical protein